MRVPFSWLKEYVDIDCSARELQDILFGCGFEVEELIDLAGDFNRVVVGEVTECVPQEGTHLFLCRIDAGEYGKDIEISTGAPNVYQGMKTVAALDDSTLPGGIHIKARKMQGHMSYGMLCSGEELGLNEDLFPGSEVYGLLDLPKDSVNGTPIAEVVGLNDYIFDIALTANRPDCNSILGMAREVAAALDKPLKMPATDYECTDYEFEGFQVSVEAPEFCPRYTAHGVHNIRYDQSPQWMKRYLALCGLRSISVVVDITNFVMLEMGQPMHAFDLEKLESNRIIVRRAVEGEKIVTLDGKEFTLNPENLMICDGLKPECLGGIMGGLSSEITENTRELLLECAKFERDNIRKTSRSLGQSTDSSAHYERGVSEYTVELGMARALHLIQELQVGEISRSHFDIKNGQPFEGPYEEDGLHFTGTLSGINRILGIDVPADTVLDILRRLSFKVTRDGDHLDVIAPRYREDIEIGDPDLAEEVIREYGYDKIIPTFMKDATVTSGGLTPEQQRREKVKHCMCAQGFYEIQTLSFYSDADLDALHFAADAVERNSIRILNPITDRLSIMRTTLAPSMLTTVVDNIKFGNMEGRVFELENVYFPKALPVTELPDEIPHLGFAVYGNDEDFFTVKGAVEGLAQEFGLTFEYERAQDVPYLHPGIAAYIVCEGERIGVFGKISNLVTSELSLPKDSKANHKIFLGEIDYPKMVSHIRQFVYKPVSEFPAVVRDLALVADEEQECGTIVKEIKNACPAVSEVELFDIYRSMAIGKGKKSMAFKITFVSDEKALSPEDVNRFIKKILGNLKFRLGIEMR